jgi:release factor glutamine methyltransferase
MTSRHGQILDYGKTIQKDWHVRTLWHALWRQWIVWRFRLFQQHRHRRLTLERSGDLPILVLPDVFNPTLFHTSEALVAQLHGREIRPDMTILDMGTGSGIAAIAVARRGARVVAVDISAEAVRCARINVLLNRVDDRVEVRCGDLFQPVGGERFDLILFNPPFYAGPAQEVWEHAWRSDGALDRFARDLPGYLTPTGRAILIVSSTTVGVDEALIRHHLQSRLLWKRDMMNERLMVLEWTTPSSSKAELS